MLWGGRRGGEPLRVARPNLVTWSTRSSLPEASNFFSIRNLTLCSTRSFDETVSCELWEDPHTRQFVSSTTSINEWVSIIIEEIVHLLSNQRRMEHSLGQLGAILATQIQSDQTEDELLQTAQIIAGQLTFDTVGGRQKDLLRDKR